MIFFARINLTTPLRFLGVLNLKFDNSLIFKFLIYCIKFLNSILRFEFNHPKNLNNEKKTSKSKDCFFVIVRQNKYNFYFKSTIKLFYFIHILYILEPTIGIFQFSVFLSKIVTIWPPFWFHDFDFFFIFEAEIWHRTHNSQHSNLYQNSWNRKRSCTQGVQNYP